MDSPLLQTALRAPGLSGSVLVLLAAYAIRFFLSFHWKKMDDSPILGKSGDADYQAALDEGYKKFKDSTFTIPTAHHAILIVPTKFLDEIKALPENVVSLQTQTEERFLGKYTGIRVNDVLVHSVKVDLTKNIGNILNVLQDEADHALQKTIGDLPDWSPLPLYQTLSYLVALLSSRIFVGYPLNQNEAWIRATLGYAIQGFTGSDKLWTYPRLLHPIVRYFIPEIRNVHKYLAEGQRLLEPIMKERRAAMGQDPNYKKPSDMIQWISDNSDETEGKSTQSVTSNQMFISVVAIRTTAMTMAQAMFDLVARPEYIEPLRDEVERVRAEDGSQWTKASMAKLRKMDSFLKESQRFRPFGLVTMLRKCRVDIKLSNGIVLPKGSHIGVAAGANALDSELFENSSEFDGFRFEKLRAIPGNDNKYQFVTTNSTDQLAWGVGTHACPGRFFASYGIKMLLAEILLAYDIKLQPGTERPKSIARDIRLRPNPVAEILFRNIQEK